MGSRIKADSIFVIGLALAVLLIPIKWLLAWVIATAVHEGFHLLALRLFRCRIHHVKLGFGGAQIETETDSDLAEVVCAAAGPIGSLFLLLLVRWLPAVAICGFIQGIYNLLPLYPMDGGRVAKLLLKKLLPGQWCAIGQRVLRWSVYAMLVAVGVAFLRASAGTLPLIAATAVIWKDRKNSLQKLP